MKLSALLLLTLAISMATAYNYARINEETEEQGQGRDVDALIESMFAGKQEIEGCACMKSIDLFAKTSTLAPAASSGPHQFEVTLSNGEKRQYELTGPPPKGESKMWTFDLDSSGSQKCVSVFDIKSIAINALSTDGWNINSAVTVMEDSTGQTFTGSIDRGINAWVDHKDLPIYERLELSLTGHN